MWQMVFTHISVKGWIIDPYVQSLFYCPNLVQVLSPNNFEIIDGNTVTTDVTMVKYRREGFQVFLEPFSKSSRGLSNILLITVHPVTMITVDDSTLFLDWVFVLWRHQEVLDGSASLTMHLHPKFSANVFNALAEPSIVWYHYTGSLDDVPISVVCLFSGWIVSLLKIDQSRMILTADKGVVLVMLNTEDYMKKAEDLLNQNTYRVLTSNPTMKLKNKMINLLKSIKSKGGITEELYKRLYPTGAGSPKFYGLPKIHKPRMPLRPIVSSIGAVTYQTS